MNDDPNGGGRHELRLNDELTRFAADLARLRPRGDRLDRERLAFLAGQASVAAAPVRPARLLGLSVESRAWSAAFASMSAVAATLFIALLARPENQVNQPRAGNEVANIAIPRLSIDGRDDRDVLSTRDAYLVNVEARLARRESDRAGTESSPAASDVRNVPILTPTAWKQVIDETEAAQPSPRDATGCSQNRGVNS